MEKKNFFVSCASKWMRMRSAPDADHRLIAVIPEGKGQAKRHVVPRGPAVGMARDIVRGNARSGRKVKAYVYDHRAEQVANF